MYKTKNFNVILAIIFTAITCAISVFSLIYIIDKYPVGFNGLSLFTSGVLLFAASLLLLIGILLSKKILISLSGLLLSIYSIICAVFYVIKNVLSNSYYSYYAAGYGINLLQFAFMLIPVIAFLFVFLYSLGIIKNKKFLIISLFITWIFLFITSLRSGFAPETFMVSAYILLLMYTNIYDISSPVKMGEVFCLSIVTFEIYYIYWCIKTVKKVACILKKDVNLSELILFTFFFPYAGYWFYTRYEDLNNSEFEVKNRGTLCMILSLLLLHPISLCIMQRDLNILSENFLPEEAILEEENESIKTEIVFSDISNEYTTSYTEDENSKEE